MKTTLEVPDALYREVKSRAALRGRKVKDYVTEGLRLALAAEESRGLAAKDLLAVFDEIRSNPLHSGHEINEMILQARSERSHHWRDER